MFKPVLIGLGIAVSLTLAGLLGSLPPSRAYAQATPQSEVNSSPTLFQLMQELHTGKTDGYYDEPQGIGSVYFWGWDCDNDFDLTEQGRSSRGYTGNIEYAYMDGTALHKGETSNPDEAVKITSVCWAMFFERPSSATPQADELLPADALVPDETDTLIAQMSALRTCCGVGTLLPWQKVNSTVYLGQTCNNSFDLTSEALAREGVERPVTYVYSDGESQHNGDTSHPGEAVEINHVCWAVFFF